MVRRAAEVDAGCVEQEISSPGTAARTAATTGSSTAAAIESPPSGAVRMEVDRGGAGRVAGRRVGDDLLERDTGTAGWSAAV